MKKIILVNVSKGFEPGIMPLGLVSLATYVKKYSDTHVTILDSNCQDIYKDFHSADVVGISAVTNDIERAVKFAEFVKQKKGIPIILGGVHISTYPLLPEPFDLGVLGEGEATLLEIIQKNDISRSSLEKVKGVCFRVNGQTVVTPARDPIIPLDLIPIPDRDLCNMDYYLKERRIIPYHSGRSLTIMTSRGCPFNCSFCSTKVHWNKFRGFSAERVVEEMDILINKYKAQIIHVFDDLFIADKRRLIKIHDILIKKRLNGKAKLMCLVRSDMLDESTIKILKDMNVVVMGMGFESGSAKMLAYLKNNTTTVQKNREAIELSNKYKIPTMGSFMIGTPNETEKDLFETLEFIKEYRYSLYLAPLTYVAAPFPGTDFWDFATKRGVTIHNFNNFIMDLPKRITQLKNVPLLTDIPVKKFFEIIQLFIKENRYVLVKKEVFMPTNFLSLLKAYAFAIFIEKSVVKGIREVNKMRKPPFTDARTQK